MALDTSSCEYEKYPLSGERKRQNALLIFQPDFCVLVFLTSVCCRHKEIIRENALKRIRLNLGLVVYKAVWNNRTLFSFMIQNHQAVEKRGTVYSMR